MSRNFFQKKEISTIPSDAVFLIKLLDEIISVIAIISKID